MDGGIRVAVAALVALVVDYIVRRVRDGIASDESKSGYGRMDGAVSAAIDEEDGKPRNLLIRTLQDMGCQCRMDDSDRIEFKYQGETFVADARNDRAFIWILQSADDACLTAPAIPCDRLPAANCRGWGHGVSPSSSNLCGLVSVRYLSSLP